MQSVSTMLASMLGKQHYPQQRSQHTDKWQHKTENIYEEFDKVEAILDSSLEDFNQSVETEAIPLTYQHDDEDYYNDDPDDGVEVLQKEICKYGEEDGRNQPSAKQRQTKQQIDNEENDANNHLTKQQAKQKQECDTEPRPYGAKLTQKYWQNRFDKLYNFQQSSRPYRAI